MREVRIVRNRSMIMSARLRGGRASDSRGLSLDELLQAYQDLSGVPLSPSDHGFTRQAFVLFLTGQLPVVYEPLGKGGFS